MIKLKFIPDYFPIILIPLYCVIVKIKYCIKERRAGVFLRFKLFIFILVIESSKVNGNVDGTQMMKTD